MMLLALGLKTLVPAVSGGVRPAGEVEGRYCSMGTCEGRGGGSTGRDGQWTGGGCWWADGHMGGWAVG